MQQVWSFKLASLERCRRCRTCPRTVKNDERKFHEASIGGKVGGTTHNDSVTAEFKVVSIWPPLASEHTYGHEDFVQTYVD